MIFTDTFEVARLPHILFGGGRISELAAQIARYGQQALIVTGARSFQATPHWKKLQVSLHQRGITWEHVTVSGEPSPTLVDAAVQTYKNAAIQVVVGIGGGSVLDAAKAIAGLLPHGNSVMDHLEGVGKEIPYHGPALPLIAVPTTAGTGSEATKNAVLSIQGQQGFKKSFRHDSLVPCVAIVDPELLTSCPPALLAADGMDAFTQLLEAYVSIKASTFTDALALSGMDAFQKGFSAIWRRQEQPVHRNGYAQLAYASLLSGICLAQAGLGAVHGLASPLGAFFPCPHGVVCGTLVAEATATNITALEERLPDSIALTKYAQVGRLIADGLTLSQKDALKFLVEKLRDWTIQLELPRLGSYGMQSSDIEKIVANCRGGSMKTNPIVLTDRELHALLKKQLI